MPELPSGVTVPQTPPPPAAGAVPPAPVAAQAAAPVKPAEQTGQKFVPISAMHEERDRRQAAEAKYSELQAEVEHLKGLMNQYQPPTGAMPQQQQMYPFQQQPQQQWTPYQAAPQPIKEQIDALWQEDIRKGFQAEMMAMMQYRDHVAAKVDQEADMLKGKASDFGNYESKVRSYIRQLPLDAQAQPNIVQAAYLMMRGQDTDNILKTREAELMRKYQGGAGAAGLNGTFGNPAPAEGNNTLSQDELLAAQAQGMTPEEYLKWR